MYLVDTNVIFLTEQNEGGRHLLRSCTKEGSIEESISYLDFELLLRA